MTAHRGRPPGDLARHPASPTATRCSTRSTRTSTRCDDVRELVAGGDRDGLLGTAGTGARRRGATCPSGMLGRATDLVELRIPVPDRPGVIAEVTTLAGRLGVNIADFEIAHSLEGGAGVLVLVVAGRRRRRVRRRAARARLPHRPDGAAREHDRARRTSSRSAGRARCAARVRVPGDKSISHRALLFAAIADGASTIANLATGDDVARDPRRARAARRQDRGRASTR